MTGRPDLGWVDLIREKEIPDGKYGNPSHGTAQIRSGLVEDKGAEREEEKGRRKRKKKKEEEKGRRKEETTSDDIWQNETTATNRRKKFQKNEIGV